MIHRSRHCSYPARTHFSRDSFIFSRSISLSFPYPMQPGSSGKNRHNLCMDLFLFHKHPPTDFPPSFPALFLPVPPSHTIRPELSDTIHLLHLLLCLCADPVLRSVPPSGSTHHKSAETLSPRSHIFFSSDSDNTPHPHNKVSRSRIIAHICDNSFSIPIFTPSFPADQTCCFLCYVFSVSGQMFPYYETL